MLLFEKTKKRRILENDEFFLGTQSQNNRTKTQKAIHNAAPPRACAQHDRSDKPWNIYDGVLYPVLVSSEYSPMQGFQ